MINYDTLPEDLRREMEIAYAIHGKKYLEALMECLMKDVVNTVAREILAKAIQKFIEENFNEHKPINVPIKPRFDDRGRPCCTTYSMESECPFLCGEFRTCVVTSHDPKYYEEDDDDLNGSTIPSPDCPIHNPRENTEAL